MGWNPARRIQIRLDLRQRLHQFECIRVIRHLLDCTQRSPQLAIIFAETNERTDRIGIPIKNQDRPIIAIARDGDGSGVQPLRCRAGITPCEICSIRIERGIGAARCANNRNQECKGSEPATLLCCAVLCCASSIMIFDSIESKV